MPTVRPRRRRGFAVSICVALVAAACLAANDAASQPATRLGLPERTQFDPTASQIGPAAAEVLAVAYSPDGLTLAIGDADGAS